MRDDIRRASVERYVDKYDETRSEKQEDARCDDIARGSSRWRCRRVQYSNAGANRV